MALLLLVGCAGVVAAMAVLCAVGQGKAETDHILEKYRDLLAQARRAREEAARKRAAAEETARAE